MITSTETPSIYCPNWLVLPSLNPALQPDGLGGEHAHADVKWVSIADTIDRVHILRQGAATMSHDP